MIVGREIEDWRHAISKDWRFAIADLIEVKIDVELVNVWTAGSGWEIDGWRRVRWHCFRLLRQ